MGSSIQPKELALYRIVDSSSTETDGVLVRVLLIIRCCKIISGLFVSHINRPERLRLLS